MLEMLEMLDMDPSDTNLLYPKNLCTGFGHRYKHSYNSPPHHSEEGTIPDRNHNRWKEV